MYHRRFNSGGTRWRVQFALQQFARIAQRADQQKEERQIGAPFLCRFLPEDFRREFRDVLALIARNIQFVF
jgi:hypothetical protein